MDWKFEKICIQYLTQGWNAWKKLPELNQKYKKEVADKIKVIYEALLEADAEKGMKNAEKNQTQANVDTAIALIKKLPAKKQALYKERLEAVKKAISSKGESKASSAIVTRNKVSISKGK